MYTYWQNTLADYIFKMSAPIANQFWYSKHLNRLKKGEEGGVVITYGDFFSAKKMSPCYKVHKKNC